MNTEQIKNNDPIQLKQMIIFLKAELAKYEYKVKEYENSDDYTMIESLEQENAKLITEKNELAKKLREAREVKYTMTVDKMRGIRTDWLPLNKQSHELVKAFKESINKNQTRYEHHERQIAALHKEIVNYKSIIEQFETKVVDLVQTSANRVHTQMESLTITNEERFQFEEATQRYLKEIDKKNDVIAQLQQEIIALQEQLEVHSARSEEEDGATAKLFQQVEEEMKEVLAKSAEYEAKLDAKLAIIHELENKLNALAADIYAIDVGGTADEDRN